MASDMLRAKFCRHVVGAGDLNFAPYPRRRRCRGRGCGDCSGPARIADAAIECSGNHGLPFFDGGVGNARWAGTALAPILEEAGILDRGIEIVFWGADEGEITRPDDVKFKQNFARRHLACRCDGSENILCYEMNGAPLPADNGFPLRLIAPGWYGIANAKWLTRIDVRDHRFEGRFMGRDYVTLREEDYNGETVWVETSGGRARLASAPARVSHIGSDYRIVGAAWARRSTGLR